MTEKERREKQKEDAMWEENDKQTLKKKEKEREEAKKEAERARREAEKKEQLIQEEQEITKGKHAPPKKLTKRQMQADLDKALEEYEKQRQRELAKGGVVEIQLPEKINNRENGVAPPPDVIQSSGSAGDAVSALKKGEEEIPDDRHIGKRARVLYKQFFKENIQAVKEEKPGMRRTQYNDVLWDMWLKSPANPFVQRNEQRNWERLQAEREWINGGGSDEEDEEEEDA
ncbi:hypothetical protein AGDE_05182 [Angomonas deanei]|nr:hypothetical protein AGDE_05182 [Angomonas deanei]|eukprot:EPY38747.1 hypothetical protein AGDE_05182 [Angomonas deanei]